MDGVADPQFFPRMAQDWDVFYAAMQNKNLILPFIRSMAARSGVKPEDILNEGTFINLMQTPNGRQIFENLRVLASNGKVSHKVMRDLFIGLLKDGNVVRELSKIPWVGEKLIATLNEFGLPLSGGVLLRGMCSDALLNSGRTDEAVWQKILETPESRTVLWEVCNELATKHGPRAQVYFSCLTQSETFRRLAIGHEPGHGHAESTGNPAVLAEMGKALSSPAKSALLLGKMPSETTYGESCKQYHNWSLEIPQLQVDAHAGPRYANFAQEMLRQHSGGLFTFLNGMAQNDVETVLSNRAGNGCTPLEFAVLNRRDSTVKELADFYRQKGIPFSRVGLQEMLAFKKEIFEDTAEALQRAGRVTVGMLASFGGGALADPTTAEWNEIQKKYPNGSNCWEQRMAALNKLVMQKQAALEADQGQLLTTIATYEKAIAEMNQQGKDAAPLQETLNTLFKLSTVGVSGRIKLAVDAINGSENERKIYEEYMDRLIGTSPGTAKSVAGTLDEKILNATEIEFTGRDEAGWTAMVGGTAVRLENIADLNQCQNLENITFGSYFRILNPLTADELFSLRNVKALKKLDVSRFSSSLTPNLVEILFRARPDLSISAVLADERKLIWGPGHVQKGEGLYSCCLEQSVFLTGKGSAKIMTQREIEESDRRTKALERDMAARDAELAREASHKLPKYDPGKHLAGTREKMTKERPGIPGSNL
jgi:hypothetical protein